MAVSLTDGPFDPYAALAEYQGQRFPHGGTFGATASFVGTMRDFNDGSSVSHLVLEHYPGMTERHLERIVADAAARFGLLEALVIHRVGAISPGEAIVLVATWSAHRAAAFDACRAIMEDLKAKAPFWKRETRPDGERWVEHNTPG
ncbi:MAG: molybdenum cofactor biosynthesis protein MoaE [Candidatus Competibacterales bacterium]